MLGLKDNYSEIRSADCNFQEAINYGESETVSITLPELLMNLLKRSRFSNLGHRRLGHLHLHPRSLYSAVTSIRCPRDRGLDHAVERERHLKSVVNIKNLIMSEPSKSMPLSLIAQSKDGLGIPFRTIEFIRKYPSIFQEFQPGFANVQPHIRLTPELTSLSSEETLLHQSMDYKQDIAVRLLKLLMIGRISKIPIFLLERLKWELGLPHDYEKTTIPEFPDYFRVISGKHWCENEKILELVCWTNEFAVPEMEKKGQKEGKIDFFSQYSNGFEMDNKYKKWLDEWQKLPYVSPYQNAMHLASKTDESDKWAVAVLHEVLNLFVGKKAERETLLYLGEFWGLRSRFKLAMLQHPGIFYVSSKIGTRTVLLREAYKRGMLIEKHPLMDLRFKYAKLMNVSKEEMKPAGTLRKAEVDVKNAEGEEFEDREFDEKDNEQAYDSPDDHDLEAMEVENVSISGTLRRKDLHFDEKNTKRRVERRPAKRKRI